MVPLPENLKAYKSTPEFTEETIPSGLLANHSTKAGTWGLVQLTEGTVDLVVPEQGDRVITLTPERPGVIIPETVHYLKLKGPVRFSVTFLR
ncbi:MAG: DUF1971 domain-containing protein [Acidobacteriota bacterium]|nr:DUF1971 domain-containing protein [Acidobacteriota bacterium]